MDVTHLNLESCLMRMYGHELWSFHPFPSARTRSSADARTLGSTLRCGEQSSTFWVSSAVDLHGLCATDLEGRTARHRLLSQFQSGSALSPRISGEGCQVYLGRCQRATGLPNLIPQVPAGIPSELLLRRPDLRAADWTLFASENRLFSAKTERLNNRIDLLLALGDPPTHSLTRWVDGSTDLSRQEPDVAPFTLLLGFCCLLAEKGPAQSFLR